MLYFGGLSWTREFKYQYFEILNHLLESIFLIVKVSS